MTLLNPSRLWRRTPKAALLLASLGLALPAVGLAGCGEEAAPNTMERGVPGAKKKKSRRAGAAAEAEEPEAAPVLKRPRPVLTRDDFHPELTRDPFQSFLGTEVVELAPDRPRGEREVRLGDYNFEDLKLIAIVHSGRHVVPRALFLASDGKSKTIKQGEYFSRAEVLLAAVNRDYVEIEVVDEDLASSLNLTRGERRAIYLKTE